MSNLVKPDDRVKTVRSLLDQLKPQMAAALPRHITAERMARVVMTQIQNNPYLLNCDKTTLLSSIMTACQLGLEPDGVLGHGYLVPFAGKVQFIPGYKGYIKLARQSGEVTDFYAMDVCANDEFDIVHGLHRDLKHKMAAGARGAVIGFYAVAKFKNGGFDFKYMTIDEINAIRDKAQGYIAFKAGKIKETPWATSPGPMGIKTVIRQLAKFLPMSVQLQQAAVLEDNYEAGRGTIIEGDNLVITTEMIDDVAKVEPEAKKAAKSKLDQFAGIKETSPVHDEDGVVLEETNQERSAHE
jgi:recombination protein RecT